MLIRDAPDGEQAAVHNGPITRTDLRPVFSARTEQAHVTSPNEHRRARHIGTYALALLGSTPVRVRRRV
jgi:hypothetical protein